MTTFATVAPAFYGPHGQPLRIKGGTAYGHYHNGPDQVALAKQAGLNTHELVNFFARYQSYAHAMSEDTWQPIDAYIAAASAAGQHVILHLAEFGWALHGAGKSAIDQGEWNAFLDFIARRKNTVSGALYGQDPTIILVQIWGEIAAPNYPHPVGDPAQLVAFFAQTMAHWKSLSPILVGSGGLSYLSLNDSAGIDWQQIFADPNCAVAACEVNSIDDWHITVPMVSAWARDHGKPWFLAAWSACVGSPRGTWDADYYTDETGRAQHVTDMLALSRGITTSGMPQPVAIPPAGFSFWNFGRDASAHTCDIGPQFPLSWAALQQG